MIGRLESEVMCARYDNELTKRPFLMPVWLVNALAVKLSTRNRATPPGIKIPFTMLFMLPEEERKYLEAA